MQTIHLFVTSELYLLSEILVASMWFKATLVDTYVKQIYSQIELFYTISIRYLYLYKPCLFVSNELESITNSIYRV